jgi:hypothetical protein
MSEADSHMAQNMFDRFDRDRLTVPFEATVAGGEPLTWGQKAILRDMRDSGNQFSMGGRMDLPEGSTVQDAADRLTGLMVRHAALRVHLETDATGRLRQRVAAAGETDLEVLTAPDDADPVEVARFAAEFMDEWPLLRFDFERDWPLRMAVVRHRGAGRHLVWALSHLVADGGAHLLMLADLLADGGRDPRRPDTLDVARGEQEPSLRQVSSRAMRHWETQLRSIPEQTFGPPGVAAGEAGQRYQQVRFCSTAAHLAVLAIARRTGTDVARVTLAVIAVAIGRTTGVNPLTLKVMVNNRFRSGLADVIASIAQNSAVTIDTGDTTVDEVVARARGASVTAGMRAYYDPDDLGEVMARLDAERGCPATVTCRVNDQRAMVLRDEQAEPSDVTAELIRHRLPDSVLSWLGPREHAHEQANILIENQPGVVSLYLIWDQWSLTPAQAEAMLRTVETVAVEAAFDPAAPTQVPSR